MRFKRTSKFSRRKTLTGFSSPSNLSSDVSAVSSDSQEASADFQPTNSTHPSSTDLPEESPQILFRRAQKRIMNLLSLRNYSRLELRKKLKEKYEPQIIESAMAWAEEQKWLPAETEIAARTTEVLFQRNKGSRFIQNYLKERGLPSVQIDAEQELERANELVETKWRKHISNFSEMKSLNEDQMNQQLYLELRKLKEKIGRFLVSRGFESDIVRKVLHEKLRN